MPASVLARPGVDSLVTDLHSIKNNQTVMTNPAMWQVINGALLSCFQTEVHGLSSQNALSPSRGCGISLCFCVQAPLMTEFNIWCSWLILPKSQPANKQKNQLVSTTRNSECKTVGACGFLDFMQNRNPHLFIACGGRIRWMSALIQELSLCCDRMKSLTFS